MELAFRLPGGFSHLITHKLHGIVIIIVVTVVHGGQKLLDRDVDFADVLVAEAAVADELDDEGEAVVLGERLVDGEGDGEVPGGVGAGATVDVGLGFLRGFVRVAGDRNDGVYVHFGNQIHVFQVICGDYVQL